MKRLLPLLLLAVLARESYPQKFAVADSVYPVPTVITASFLDGYALARTDSASAGNGAWRVQMTTTKDGVSRYLVVIKSIASMQAPASISIDLRVPLWIAPRRARVAASFFKDGAPVVNSNLDTVSASGGYQTYTLRFPSVAGEVNQVVLWFSYLTSERGTLAVFFDQLIAGGVVLEDGETGADVTAPAVPTDVVLTAVSSASAEAQAKAPSDLDAASILFQLGMSAAFSDTAQQVVVPATPGGTAGAVFLNLAPGTVYYLRAAARDSAGNQSAFSVPDTARTLAEPTGTPEVPRDFSFTATSESMIVATFAHGGGATQTEVQIAEGSVFLDRYAAIIVPVSGFSGRGEAVFSGLRAGTVYAGRARSINTRGTSVYTGTMTARTYPDATSPQAITDLVATAISRTQVKVRFTIPTSSDAMTGTVRWSKSSNFLTYWARTVGVAPGVSSVEISGLLPGTVYWFEARLTDRNGNESASSNVDTARTFDVATGVEDNSVPTEFVLKQNYPNPFNPSTTIEFALPERNYVRLTVYNAIGQEVAKLVDEEVSAGTYKTTWDASGLPSGIYFSRLETKQFFQTRKMMLVK